MSPEFLLIVFVSDKVVDLFVPLSFLSRIALPCYRKPVFTEFSERAQVIVRN